MGDRRGTSRRPQVRGSGVSRYAAARRMQRSRSKLAQPLRSLSVARISANGGRRCGRGHARALDSLERWCSLRDANIRVRWIGALMRRVRVAGRDVHLVPAQSSVLGPGSFDSFQVSCWWGLSPNARQIRETAVCVNPTSAAIDRGRRVLEPSLAVFSPSGMTCCVSAKVVTGEVPTDLDVHIVLDNSSTHKTPQIKRWLELLELDRAMA